VVTDPCRWIDTAADRVTVDGRQARPIARSRVVIYNKPRGVLVTRRDPEGRPTVHEELPEAFRGDPSLRPVGRLDRASAGLLLFTDDTDLADGLLGPDSGVHKTYRVKLVPTPSQEDLSRLRAGIDIGDATPTAPARIEVERRGVKSAVLRVTLAEGRNRQIRRMAAAVACEVEWLVRTAFGAIRLGNLRPGDAREATTEECAALLDAIRPDSRGPPRSP
ncbi:MAG: pseudouridine synthase, partial [Planctomycetota bacterium]